MNGAEHLASAASQVDHAPTERQKRAGNYRMGHVKAHGFDVAIENARGSFRRGVAKDGKPWSVKMPHHYGYIKRTRGADGDHVDIYIGPHLKSPRVFVVDQYDADTGHFDEHKAFFGFASANQVKRGYAQGFSDGRAHERLGKIHEMSVDAFRHWLENGDQKKPLERASGGRAMAGGGVPDGPDPFAGIAPIGGAGQPSISAGSPPPSGPDPFADLSPGPTDEHAATFTSLVKQTGLGVARGITGLAGMVAEAASFKPREDFEAAVEATKNLPPEQRSAAAQKIFSERTADSYGARAQQALGLEGENAPQNALERIASGVGEGIGGGLIFGPEGALMGGVGGGTGAAAAEAVPDEYKPWANIAGNILGPSAVGALAGLSRGVTTMASHAAEPFYQAGQERIAGRALLNRADNPETLEQSLNASAWPRVPGSEPTTFQLTGDMGIGGLEREMGTKDQVAFAERRAAQNAARVGALNEVQQAGDPAAVGQLFRDHLTNIQNSTDQAVQQATTTAQQAAQGLGGVQSQEAYGTAFRGAITNAETNARQAEGRLWNAIDPDGTLTIGTNPIKQAYGKTYGNMTDAGTASLTPAETSLGNVIEGYGNSIPFRELKDLRSSITSNMAQEARTNGRSPAWARLLQLRQGVENAIGESVAQKAETEAQAVASGALNPEQTIAANLQRQVADWRAAQAAGGNLARDTGAAGAVGTPVVRPAPGGGQPGEGGPGNAPGNQGVQGAPVTTPFDQAAADRYAAASQATRTRAGTYNAQPIKGITKTTGFAGNYALPTGAVPNKVFHPGDTGFDDVNAFRNAVGDETALPLIRDYAAASLREAAQRPDGTIDPARFARWQANHAEALRAVPETAAQFGNAAAATEAVGQSLEAQRSALQAAQQGVAGKLLGLTDPADVTRTVGRIFSSTNAVQQMRDLVQRVGSNQDALAGLRKAVMDHVSQNFKSMAEAGTSGERALKADAFQKFVLNNEPTLRQVLDPQQVQTLKAVAADLRRANRSIVAVKRPGGSDTAANQYAVGKNAVGQSRLTRLLLDLGATAAGYHFFGGMEGTVGGAFIGDKLATLRAAGLDKADTLLKEAVLNPEAARGLLSKLPVEFPRAGWRATAKMITALGAMSAARQMNQQVSP
ncbi:MAG: hypothetical protein KGL39_31360 [Patescibacteria group bacterium]|nr:hypothetical protein [Patescibacteria group bacterium]